MSVHLTPEWRRAQPSKVPSTGLDAAAIVDGALDLMGEIGIEALTTRRLADRLGVKGPALYWHFRSKDDLLAHMCERLLSIALDRTSGASWQDWIRSACLELRRTLNSVRDGARLVAFAEWTEGAKTELIARVEAPLLAAGIDKTHAMQIVVATNAYTIGWVTTESKADHRSFMASMFDIDAAFDNGLEAILTGLAERLQPAIREDAATTAPVRQVRNRP